MTVLLRFFAGALAAGILSISATMAFGQAIPVRSGEHEDFSRLVLDFPEPVDWQFGKVEGGYEFRSDRPEARFLLGNVFLFIPRDRIKSVDDLGGGRMFIAVDCDCYADAFDLRGGKVVLDIKDGPPLASARIFNQPLPELPAKFTSQNRTQAGTGIISAPPADAALHTMEASGKPSPPLGMVALNERSPFEVRRGLPLLLSQNTITPQTQVPVPISVPTSRPPAGSEDSGLSPEETGTRLIDRPSEPVNGPPGEPAQNRDKRVTETQRELLVQIGRAAAQGLLEADTSRTDALLSQPEPSDNGALPEETATKETPLPPPEPEDHVFIQTAIDQQFTNPGQTGAVTGDGFACPQDLYFDVASWGEDPSKGADFGPYRTALVGEFDAPQPDAVLALVRYYIYLTFGAEAAAVLNKYEIDPEQEKYLRILAQIMDRREADNEQVLAPFAACDGKVALWSLLSVEHIDPLQEINVPAVAATFSALPIHLRRYLAPPLVNRLLEVGADDLATMIRNSVERAARAPDPAATFVEAQLQMNQGKADEAVAALKEVAFGNSDHASEALLELIDFKLKNGLEITEKEISAAASFAFEQRGTETGRALQVAEIKALAETARFPEAFERLGAAEARGDLLAADREVLLSSIFHNLALKASDAQFLRFALDKAVLAPLSDEARIAVASRFSDLGFNKEARSALNQSAKLPDTKARLLFAKIAIAERKYNVALGYLAGLETEAALRLRAEALAGQKEMQAAIQAFTQAGDHQAALQLAWRDGDWQKISTSDDEVLAAASRLMLTPPTPAPDQAQNKPVLNTDAELLAESEKTREVITQLMRRFPDGK